MESPVPESEEASGEGVVSSRTAWIRGAGARGQEREQWRRGSSGPRR